MAYDFHGKWERETGHNAPLYAPSTDSEWRKQLSVDNAASLWVKMGAPKEKLVIGMPTYGRSFTLANPDKHGPNAPASGVDAKVSTPRKVVSWPTTRSAKCC